MTGGTGALGGVVLDELLARGHRVRGLRRRNPGRTTDTREGVTWIDGALDDVEALDQLVDGTDAIVHLAYCPMEDPPREGRSVAEHFVQNNVVGTLRLLERAPRTRLGQLLFTSTLAVFGPNPHRLPGADRIPLDESFPLWPSEFYGAHKLALEKMLVAGAATWGVNTSVWRIGLVLGDYPDPDRDYLTRFVTAARETGRIDKAFAAYSVTASDAARILADALGDDAVRGRVFHVFDRWLDFTDLARRLGVPRSCDAAPEPSPRLLKPQLDAREPTFTTDAWLATRLAR